MKEFDKEKMEQMTEMLNKYLSQGNYDSGVEDLMKDAREQMGKPNEGDDSFKMEIKYYDENEDLDETKELKYEHEGDSGFDIRCGESEVTLEPMERKMVGTGLYFALPDNIELQIRPKSGLAIKKGLTVLNTPGTVDSNFRGEVRCILINLSGETQKLEYGDKIAQGVISTVNSGMMVNLKPSSYKDIEEDETSRGSGGFGSTGEK